MASFKTLLALAVVACAATCCVAKDTVWPPSNIYVDVAGGICGFLDAGKTLRAAEVGDEIIRLTNNATRFNTIFTCVGATVRSDAYDSPTLPQLFTVYNSRNTGGQLCSVVTSDGRTGNTATWTSVITAAGVFVTTCQIPTSGLAPLSGGSETGA